MPTKSPTLPLLYLCTVLFGCSDKTGLTTRLDASPPDAVSDVVAAPDLPADVANSAELVPDVRLLPDLAADAAVAADLGADVRAGSDASADLATGKDAAPDDTTLPDLAADLRSAVDPPPDGPRTPTSDAVSEAGYAVDAAVDTRAPGDRPTEARPDVTYADACQAVANSTFLSVSELECGLTPTGVGTCHWRLVFTDNGATRQVSWRLSDYMLTLQYQCNGLTITATSASGVGATFTGTYSPATDVLTWDGYDYTRETP
jgi:hypothetical protein